MKKLATLLLVMLLPIVALGTQEAKGTLSVLLFNDGKPLIDNEIKIDGKERFQTDKDGSLQIPLWAGKHQVEIYGKDAKGVNLGYFKKPVSIETNKDTQVIATLSQNGADSIDIDTPVASAVVADAKVQEATGTGVLKGRILSSQGNTPIEGARVFVRGTAVDTRTDAKGYFVATVPSGKKLTISVVHSAYSAQTVGGILVKKNATTSKTVKLTPASMELEEFVVLAPKVEGSIADVIAEEKNTNSIANIIGAEAFSKKGDSSAAAALKRASGITLVGGNVYVRGLGDRYGNIEMNSMPLPSPNPLKRLVPLDTFPSSVIGAMKIQKSGEADIPAGFGGGYINIRTKQSVSDDFIKITLGAGGNSYTGDEVMRQKGSSDDWTGYDKGYWARPSSPVYDAAFTQEYFKRDFTTPYEPLPMNFGGKIEGAKSYTIDEDHTITVLGSYKYQQKHEALYLEQFTNDMKQEFLGIDTDKNPPEVIYGDYFVDTIDKTTTEASTSTYAHGGVFDLGYNYLDIFRLNYTKLYTHSAQNRTLFKTYDDITGSLPTTYTTTLMWIEKTLNVDQVNGVLDYKIFDAKSEFSFGGQRATSLFDRPNDMEYVFQDCSDDLRGTPQCTSGKRLLQGATNLNIREERSEDVMDSLYLRNKSELSLVSEKDYIEIGVSLNDKSRDFQSSPGRFIDRDEVTGVEIDSNGNTIGDIQTLIDVQGDSLTFTDTPLNNSANIKASVEQSAGYAKMFLQPYEALEIVAGVRHVDITQTTSTLDVDNPEESTSDTIELNRYFPSLSMRYKYNKDNHFDFAISKTYIMPDLIEFADVTIVAPTIRRLDIVGNPELEPTLISNIDLKYSYYMGESEFIKVGTFYKEMQNPIEDVEDGVQEVPSFSFVNAKEATIYGIEFDGRKGLDFLHSYLSGFFVSGNYTYLDSKVTLTEEQAIEFTTNNRQLQGLSQHVVNVALEYESEARSLVLAYNKMGERIRQAGYQSNNDNNDVLSKNPDTYEIPPQVVDFVWTEKLSDALGLKFKVGNILNEETIWYRYGGSLLEGEGTSQDFARQNFIDSRYKLGRTFKFEASYKY